MSTQPHHSFFDRLITEGDKVLRTLATGNKASGLPSPALQTPEGELSEAERQHAAGLMRVNQKQPFNSPYLPTTPEITNKNKNKKSFDAVTHIARKARPPHKRWFLTGYSSPFIRTRPKASRRLLRVSVQAMPSWRMKTRNLFRPHRFRRVRVYIWS